MAHYLLSSKSKTLSLTARVNIAYLLVMEDLL
ncbi:hypothetical protein AVEN109717_01570 [Avibacterium endocarditidis]